MASKEKNPIKIMLVITMILVIALIAITLFWNQKTDGEKVGYFVNPDAAPTAPGTTTTTTTTANV